ncbi:hypothetical protein BDP27DRAFT_1425671 [Rhodocollybia butyracea]|uniref:Uncharacterized protein n=1 Tax=Rhodocollybia butyracea TaxID=206335 RepID=A0A9P5PJW4_9AGAR|nr:hypothetical protein BDP27DRAFT_1425671 [Rhodocollybia butyracea]
MSNHEQAPGLRMSSAHHYPRFTPYSRPTRLSNCSWSSASSSMENLASTTNSTSSPSGILLPNTTHIPSMTFPHLGTSSSSSFTSTDTSINVTVSSPPESSSALADPYLLSSLPPTSAIPTSTSLLPLTRQEGLVCFVQAANFRHYIQLQNINIDIFDSKGGLGNTVCALYRGFCLIRDILTPLGYSEKPNNLENYEVVYIGEDKREKLSTILREYFKTAPKTFDEKRRNYCFAECIGRNSRWVKPIPNNPKALDHAYGVWLRMTYLWGPPRWIDCTPSERSDDEIERHAAELRQKHINSYRSEIADSIQFGSN